MENRPRKNYVTLELGENELQNIALAQAVNFSSPFRKATSWQLEKYQGGRATSCKEKISSHTKGVSNI